MHTRLFVGLIASGMLFAPFGVAVQRRPAQQRTMSADMRRAIEFERHKDLAAARQARIEARHPTVFYNQAERSAEEETPPSRIVHDPGEPLWQQQQQQNQPPKQ